AFPALPRPPPPRPPRSPCPLVPCPPARRRSDRDPALPIPGAQAEDRGGRAPRRGRARALGAVRGRVGHERVLRLRALAHEPRLGGRAPRRRSLARRPERRTPLPGPPAP